jgi:nucleoside-diphosphate-sugar epimerase
VTSRRVVVTGAGGFIGRAVLEALFAAGHEVALVPRSALTDLHFQFHGADAVIHLAGVAHRNASAELHAEINGDLPARVARAASEAGVPRFVFASSVKAAAEHSEAVLTARDTSHPQTDYGRAKLAAERALSAIEGIDCISLRLPLVHGPGARANFAALVRLAESSLPLPFGGIANRRSLISLRSAADAFVAAACQAGPAGVFYVADAPALSTGAMIAALREGFGQPARLVSLPLAGALLHATSWRALAQSLEVDTAPFRAAYGLPETDSRAALVATARAWSAA